MRGPQGVSGEKGERGATVSHFSTYIYHTFIYFAKHLNFASQLQDLNL